MSIHFLLDTNIVSYFLRRSSTALEQQVLDGLQQGQLAVSTLTRAELRFGQAAMAADDKRRALIDQFLTQLPNLAWTEEAADQYGQIRAAHKKMGTPIGELDTQIAAHAMALKLTLVTHNLRHFERVQGLTVEDWFAG